MKRWTFHPGRLFLAASACFLVLFFAPSAFAIAIHSVHLDLTAHTISIEGHNFVGCPVGVTPPPPKVFLADEKLVITSCTEETIVATLPDWVTNGSYELKVKTVSGADIFEVTIGATGMQGPPGPPGDPATDTLEVQVPYYTPHEYVDVPILWLSNTVYIACPEGYALYDWRGLCDIEDSNACGGYIGGIWIPTPYCQVVWFDAAGKTYVNDSYDDYSRYPTGVTITMHVGVHACDHGAYGQVEAFCMKVTTGKVPAGPTIYKPR